MKKSFTANTASVRPFVEVVMVPQPLADLFVEEALEMPVTEFHFILSLLSFIISFHLLQVLVPVDEVVGLVERAAACWDRQ